MKPSLSVPSSSLRMSCCLVKVGCLIVKNKLYFIDIYVIKGICVNNLLSRHAACQMGLVRVWRCWLNELWASQDWTHWQCKSNLKPAFPNQEAVTRKDEKTKTTYSSSLRPGSGMSSRNVVGQLYLLLYLFYQAEIFPDDKTRRPALP